ncbi:hypothetical protein [Rhodopirellula sp. MGV]|uniref:hypothetical protein n=1 Tax=Rhodopirellula sp. MGV TaxID=2023130 RepID=UPI000B965911|nr:hypothetical protein [Rhodopirellula sp. MGV]OYP29972.1 hypothetical protein CGZ80_23425 [Rhodopirellula sp. MGV]PNY33428.1 hypothetical protein C2E31_28435 [Rhodopirellula baltica]
MNQQASYQIEADALHALAEWKAAFAENVASKAKEIAQSDSDSNRITLQHYRQAAEFALKQLASKIQDSDSSDGTQEAA